MPIAFWQVGMEFRDDPEIIAIFAEAGCDIDGERVRFAPGFCRNTIQATAPAEFTQAARNPAAAMSSATMIIFAAISLIN